MNKTKMGVSVGLMAALLWLLGYYSNYTVMAIAVGYVLLVEDSGWLKKQALRVIGLMLLFSLVSTVLNAIPNLLELWYSIRSLADKYTYYEDVHRVFNLLGIILSLVKTWTFVIMGVLMLFGKNFKVPVVDSLIDKLV